MEMVVHFNCYGSGYAIMGKTVRRQIMLNRLNGLTTETRENPVKGFWWHGDKSRRKNFTGQHMDRDGSRYSRNAAGPGIYLTRLESDATVYAYPDGYVYKLKINTSPGRLLGPDDPITKENLRKLIELTPKDVIEFGLSNWDENPKKAIDNAVEAYFDEEEVLDAYIGIKNDFYGDAYANEWTKAMIKIGYDAYWHLLPEIEHLVVYNPDIIEIVEELN